MILSSTRSEYGPQGRVDKTINPYGAETRTTYNVYGDVVQTATQARSASEGIWLVTRSVYDAHGRVEFSLDQVVASDPIPAELTGFGTHTVYDEQGRVRKMERFQNLKIKLASGATTVSSQGHLVSKSETVYNAKGQVARVIAADGQVTDNVYDSLGRQWATLGTPVRASSVGLTLAGDPLVRHRTEQSFDSQGRVQEQRANIVQIVDAQFQPVGAPIRTTQQTTRYQYDQFGNRVRTTFGGGTPVESFVLVHYDPQGRQDAEMQQTAAGTKAEWSDSAKSFVVPPSGGVPERIIPTKLYEYDAQGRLSAVELPGVPDPDKNDQLTRPRYEYGYVRAVVPNSPNHDDSKLPNICS